ncbi:MAG: hydroxyphenylacetyl-CoA thioesterase PaaI [Alphaproteobacteria bacterium]|nr:hydroxyphenylacetyl-CoA thioesterase PaaI [Alphaproteobacteria bacterium]
MSEAPSLAELWPDDRASQGLGMAIAALGPGSATVTMTVGPEMLNGHGICHGGFIFALADSAMAFASNRAGSEAGERALAQHCAIAYLRPAQRGDRLSAAARERGRAGRTALYDVTVVTETGTVIAEFRGQTRTLPAARPAP